MMAFERPSQDSRDKVRGYTILETPGSEDGPFVIEGDNCEDRVALIKSINLLLRDEAAAPADGAATTRTLCNMPLLLAAERRIAIERNSASTQQGSPSGPFLRGPTVRLVTECDGPAPESDPPCAEDVFYSAQEEPYDGPGRRKQFGDTVPEPNSLGPLDFGVETPSSASGSTKLLDSLGTKEVRRRRKKKSRPRREEPEIKTSPEELTRPEMTPPPVCLDTIHLSETISDHSFLWPEIIDLEIGDDPRMSLYFREGWRPPRVCPLYEPWLERAIEPLVEALMGLRVPILRYRTRQREGLRPWLLLRLPHSAIFMPPEDARHLYYAKIGLCPERFLPSYGFSDSVSHLGNGEHFDPIRVLLQLERHGGGVYSMPCIWEASAELTERYREGSSPPRLLTRNTAAILAAAVVSPCGAFDYDALQSMGYIRDDSDRPDPAALAVLNYIERNCPSVAICRLRAHRRFLRAVAVARLADIYSPKTS
mmetsp:Transcript_178845/g.573157  ORF Transcript_178845/g.573157 Transcript_178845/m.573157 type:complete len:481 (+) Transcript_178845:266-1708(+)